MGQVHSSVYTHLQNEFDRVLARAALPPADRWGPYVVEGVEWRAPREIKGTLVYLSSGGPGRNFQRSGLGFGRGWWCGQGWG